MGNRATITIVGRGHRFGRRTAIACGTAGLTAATLAGCGGSPANPVDQAAHLRQLNPAAQVQGQTIVITAENQRIVGSQSRPNFMMALGNNETIIGGPQNDELGAVGSNDTIVAGPGTSQIYGGTGSTLVGGQGRNLLTENGDNGTVRVTSSGDEVVLTGRHDRVFCSPSSQNDVVYMNTSDSVDPSCTRNHAHVLPLSHPQLTAARTAAPVSGDGSNLNPYVTSCDSGPPPSGLGLSPDDCVVSGFPSRALNGTWRSESIPSYQCPSDHPYLLKKAFWDGKTLPPGVGYLTFNTDVYIAYPGPGSRSDYSGQYLIGTFTGFGASATNWNPDIFDKDAPGSYKINLYCTSNTSRAATVKTGTGQLL